MVLFTRLQMCTILHNAHITFSTLSVLYNVILSVQRRIHILSGRLQLPLKIVFIVRFQSQYFNIITYDADL